MRSASLSSLSATTCSSLSDAIRRVRPTNNTRIDSTPPKYARRVASWVLEHLLELTRSVALWFAKRARCVHGNATLDVPWFPRRFNTPHVKATEDLQTLWHHSTIDEDGDVASSYSTFTFVTEGYKVYFGRSSNPNLTIEMVNKSLERVTNEDVYPMAPPHMTIVTKSDSSSCFKGPMLTFYVELGGSGQIAKALLQETETLELLQRNPHPNIIQYFGCQVYGGRITGLVLERHPCTLEERLRENSHGLDLKVGFDGLKAAVTHLHSLEYALNDIKRGNIMVSADGT